MAVTFNKVMNGEFQVLKNGEATQFSIHNGVHGCSGVNSYSIFNKLSQKVTPVGTLADAKKMVKMFLA